MNILNKKEPFLLFIGDLAVLTLSLWLSLFIRLKDAPSFDVWNTHFIPFFFIFLIWTICFFISGLYETHRVIIRNRLPEILIKTHIANSIIAVIFFYLTETNISPKTILSIYILVSLLFLVAWRIFALNIFVSKKKCSALLIGSGQDAESLFSEVNKIERHNFRFLSRIDPESLVSEQFRNEVIEKMQKDHVKIIVVDSNNEKILPFLPYFYEFIFSKVQFMDFHKLYGEVFYRMPLNALGYRWFIQNISIAKHTVYDVLKRTMDIVISIPAICIFTPFVLIAAIALKVQDRGEVFSIQTRIGMFGKKIKLVKLRTMIFNDNGDWKAKGKNNEVTKVGKFLRKTRIDELSQIINVLKGDVSLIGPRPEFPDAVNEYSKLIPYYNARHVIKPGLSGWAQIYHDAHPHHGIDLEETKNKLAYDLYYIKNRSIVLDVMIALKTIKTFLSREGR